MCRPSALSAASVEMTHTKGSTHNPLLRAPEDATAVDVDDDADANADAPPEFSRHPIRALRPPERCLDRCASRPRWRRDRFRRTSVRRRVPWPTPTRRR
mmetsp:Transcript_32155/g.99311  ORF Transcript_32155/g.99311 Transcript_32155/m.99311 type:complete len:99 (-) Transcript_32155:52-348(-)